MYRKDPRSKFSRNVVDGSSSSDSDSNSESDRSSQFPTASDVINSFLNQDKVVQRVNVPKFRRASDVINSFLQKNKIVDQANRSQFESALDVINSYLRKHKFEEDNTSRNESTDDSSSTSESDLHSVSRKRRRDVSETTSSSDSDSDSTADRNVAKKRRIENERIEEILNERPACQAVATPSGVESVLSNNDSPAGSTLEIPKVEEREQNDVSSCSVSNDATTQSISEVTTQRASRATRQRTSKVTTQRTSEPATQSTSEPAMQSTSEATTQSTSESTTQITSPKNSSSGKGSIKSPNNSSKAKSNLKAKQKSTPAILKVAFTREIMDKKLKTPKIIETQRVIKDNPMPKEKYDRALEILNSAESRYDETPVDYSLPKRTNDMRRSCNGRRHAEATYDTVKLGTSQPISLTRIVFEMDNCLRKENWQQMGELIYFGCGLMKTETSRRAIGTAFFTYALLLLILDSTPSSISTLGGKRNEIMKFLTALGGDPEENEEFLKELKLVTDGIDETDLLVIKSEIE